MLKFILTLLTASLAVLSVGIASPPSNDQLANATDLGSTLPIGIAGLLSEATTEAGEPLPLDNTRTIWWKWTAPKAAWIRVTTTTATCGTKLSVYEGTGNFSGLQLIGSRERNGANEFQSRLFFYARPGVAYSIQAGGDCPIEPVELNLTEPANPDLELKESSFQPTVVDVGATAKTLHARVRICASVPFDRGILYLKQPDGQLLPPVLFDLWNLVSGTELDGYYEFDYTIPAYAPPGRYDAALTLESWSGYTHILTTYGCWGEYAHPPTAQSSVEINNSGIVDDDAPALTSAQFSPGLVDVRQSAKSVTATICWDDASPVGPYANFQIIAPDRSVLAQSLITPANLTSVSGTTQCYEVLVVLPLMTPSGLYRIQVNPQDLLGNASSILSSGAPGSPGTLTIIGSKPGYEEWSFFTGLAEKAAAGKQEDPDLDGVTNLEEYAFGLDPLHSDRRETNCLAETTGLPQITKYQGLTGPYFQFCFRRRKSDPSIVYTIEQSTSLTDWNNATIFPAANLLDGTWDYFHGTTGELQGEQFFFRVKVTCLPSP